MSELQNRLGLAIERVLQALSGRDLQQAMEEIGEAAESNALIDSQASLRTENLTEFVMDLWSENPAVLDRLNLAEDEVKSPLRIREVSDVIDVINALP